MFSPDRPLDEFGHRELVVREERRHEVKEVVIVFTKNNSLQSNLGEDGFETLWELSLVLEVLCEPIYYES